MGLTMADKYKIDNPTNIRINGLLPADIKGLRTILKNEGCVDSENKFTDKEKAIALDDVQKHLSQKNSNNKKSSADILICVVKNKYLLADAKFNQKNVENLDDKELKKKLNDSKSLIQSDDFQFMNAFYVLFKEKILTNTARRKLKQMFKNSPLYRFLNAREFRDLFE